MAEENKVESGVVLPPADFTEQLQKEAQERITPTWNCSFAKSS